MTRPTPPTIKTRTPAEQARHDRETRTYGIAYGLISAMRAAGITEFDKLMDATKHFTFSAGSALQIDHHEVTAAVIDLWEQR